MPPPTSATPSSPATPAAQAAPFGARCLVRSQPPRYVLADQTATGAATCLPLLMTATVDALSFASDDIEPYFRAHYGRLVRALTLVCGDSEAAADAIQEAFVKAHLRWRKVGRYDDPIGWIRRVAINGLRDEHRRSQRKDRAVTRLSAGTADSTPAHEISELTDVAGAIAELPRQQRLAIALYYLEGLSVAETAATLDISEGAVKFHLHQGRERLRGRLAQGDQQ